jgi:hypothetical protein
MNCNGLDAGFAKLLSNDFNRLEGKWANRRSDDAVCMLIDTIDIGTQRFYRVRVK